MDLWADDGWFEAFEESMSWYALTNSRSMDTGAGIILAQTSMERLSFEYAVNKKRLLSKDGYKALSAHDRINLLLASMKIPNTIPPALAGLTKAAKARSNWETATKALTEIRNTYTHPEHKSRGQFSQVSMEASTLANMLLELCILALIGYKGDYYDRVTGRVKKVPWAL